MTDFSRPVGRNPRILKFAGDSDHNKWEDYRWQSDPFTSYLPYKNPNRDSYRDNKVYSRSRA